MIDAFIAPNRLKAELHARAFWFCVGQTTLKLLTAEIRNSEKLEALMRLNTKIRGGNFSPS